MIQTTPDPVPLHTDEDGVVRVPIESGKRNNGAAFRFRSMVRLLADEKFSGKILRGVPHSGGLR